MADLAVYQCPGDGQPIDRAIHLARLASHYAPCRDCLHQGDVGLLPRETLKRIEASRRSIAHTPRFHEEGVEGVYHNQISLASARKLAAVFGSLLVRDVTRTPDRPRPQVVLAGDGRPLTAEFLAAAAEGLRFGGCDVIEAAAATSGSLVFAIERVAADGGLLLGNPADRAHVLGVKFWSRKLLSLRERVDRDRRASGDREPGEGGCERAVSQQASALHGTKDVGPHPACGHLLPKGEGFTIVPWSAGPRLEELRAGLDRPLARTSRTSGVTSRLAIERDYLDSLADYFHALRPLRIVLRTSSSALRSHLSRLAATVACTILEDTLEPAFRRESHDRLAASPRPQLDLRALASAVVSSRAHFGLWVDGDGEAIRLVDEYGHEVTGDRLLLVLARYRLADQPGAAIAVESDCCREVIVALHAAGAAVHRSTVCRAEMAATMNECQAFIGGGPSGRCWLPTPSPAPDALHALALLLRILSQRDWPLSEVVARSLEPPAVAS